MSPWQDRPIRELCTSIIDCVNKTAPIVSGPTPYKMIRTTNVKNGRVDLANVRHVDEEVYRRWVRRGVPADGDIVLTREAPLGEVGMLHDPAGVFLGQRLIMYRADPELADRNFLFHAMRSPTVQAQIKAFGSGSTVEHMRVPDCGELLISCPDVSTQRRIGAVLVAFDELIEINERRIELLEDLARSLYREWFMRFRFPGRENSEVVPCRSEAVPTGWTERSIGEIANLFRCSVNPATQPHAQFEHFSIPAFDAGGLPLAEIGESIQSSKFLLSGECVLLSKLNPRIPRVWFATPETDSAVASSEFLPWQGTEVSNAWLWAMFSDDAFRGWLVGRSGGTSTSHQRVKPDDVSHQRVWIAESGLLQAFDSIAEPALRAVATLRRQNAHLAATRDLLLPRLVTGRLDISDIDLGDLLPAEAG